MNTEARDGLEDWGGLAAFGLVQACQAEDAEICLPGATRGLGTWWDCRHPASRMPKRLLSPRMDLLFLNAVEIRPILALPQLLWLGLLRLDVPAMLAVSSLLQERQGSKMEQSRLARD